MKNCKKEEIKNRYVSDIQLNMYILGYKHNFKNFLIFLYITKYRAWLV